VIQRHLGLLGETGEEAAYLTFVPHGEPPDEHTLNRYLQIVQECFGRLEPLSRFEGDAFAAAGDLAEDLLAIAAVHPPRESGVQALVDRSGGDWQVVEHLIADGLLTPTEYAGHRQWHSRFRRLSLLAVSSKQPSGRSGTLHCRAPCGGWESVTEASRGSGFLQHR
jgi:hypothetical protein